MTLASLLAVGWSPEIRGVIVVLIGFVVLCGSVYLILGTNLGARLGFLVSLTGLFGWLFIMGIIWWTYGIGLQGTQAAWEPAQPISVVNDGDLVAAGILESAGLPASSDDPAHEGWRRLSNEDRGRGQAIAAADVILQTEAEVFQAGEYLPLAVYDRGGERVPKINRTLDFLAFFHEPHYSLVEVQGVVPTLSEPGRAPTAPEVDPNQPKRYVLMVRNLGTDRQPSIFLTIGAGLIFFLLCYLLHRRERVLSSNLSGALEPVVARS
jgi:hypothetical protein